MRKPTVITNCIADRYTDVNERIIEFSDRENENIGGLISFRRTDDGLIVRVYRCDPPVKVIAPSDAVYEVTREMLEEMAGRPLDEEELMLMGNAIPNSSIPSALEEVLSACRNPANDPEDA